MITILPAEIKNYSETELTLSSHFFCMRDGQICLCFNDDRDIYLLASGVDSTASILLSDGSSFSIFLPISWDRLEKESS